MTDKELLELAAKAAGWMPNNNWQWSERADAFRYRLGGDWIEWNPLEDDGDALRLAVKLHINVEVWNVANRIVCNAVLPAGHIRTLETYNTDPYAATRRAIVRAAAEIGRNMT